MNDVFRELLMVSEEEGGEEWGCEGGGEGGGVGTNSPLRSFP